MIDELCKDEETQKVEFDLKLIERSRDDVFRSIDPLCELIVVSIPVEEGQVQLLEVLLGRFHPRTDMLLDKVKETTFQSLIDGFFSVLIL